MKDFLTLAITAFILWWVTSCIDNAYSETLPQEFAMKTEVGEIVLTSQACSPELAKSLYYYYAYASEPGFIHPGCWKIVEAVVHIYFPEIDTTAVYKKELFGPRQQIKPNV